MSAMDVGAVSAPTIRRSQSCKRLAPLGFTMWHLPQRTIYFLGRLIRPIFGLGRELKGGLAVAKARELGWIV
jgi:hypothetical protein